jgi:hypothetical protein
MLKATSTTYFGQRVIDKFALIDNILKFKQKKLGNRKDLRYTTILFLCSLILSGCIQPIEFSVKHLIDKNGKQITETLSYIEEPGLDNSKGTNPLQIQVKFERVYRYQIVIRMNTQELSSDQVRDKIVELYKLPPHNTEEAEQVALCPISIVIPPGKKAVITVEWVERWAEGVVNKGREAEGERLGTYSVFLGYVEPCSLINQENTD